MTAPSFFIIGHKNVGGPSIRYGERERPELWSVGLLTGAQVAHAPRTVPPDATYIIIGSREYESSQTHSRAYSPSRAFIPGGGANVKTRGGRGRKPRTNLR